MEKLTDPEKKFVALALQALAMSYGPRLFPNLQIIARKLEIESELRDYLRSWIEYANKKDDAIE